ncbi:MAG: TIGR01440 family protein [Oscillospiraceae bacterium]|nr:TIGR01440 family protein [Oscillospiraceae bacterium]MCL2277956.1 TIGR01440 family protein [Oscillospiraceae bacterium]
MSDLNDIINSAKDAAAELIHTAKLKSGQAVVVGCSTSEILGENIGTHSSIEVGAVVFDALHSVFSAHGVFLAVGCCEHLNRAVIVSHEVAASFQVVNVVPTPEAGGAFAAAAFSGLSRPVALETFHADAGLDIGNTLIGMHLKRVAVPVRLSTKIIGKAPLVAARTRPPFVGGSRAVYDETLL